MEPAFILPAPRETLAGCMWLPRLLAKARASRENTMPPDYVRSFGQAPAVDGQFLRFFGLSLEQVLEAAPLAPEQASEWFLALPGMSEARIAEWNALALNLGKAGYPMHERFQKALETTYSHVDRALATSVFEVLEADEGH